LYLTFDDGPHPVITETVLNILKKYNAKASFFCIGDNVAKYPDTYQRILSEGHTIGNHTYNHLNGWKTGDEEYLSNTRRASELIQSRLFRPPYGKIKMSQKRKLMYGEMKMKIIMWSVLSGDFDKRLTPERCARYVIRSSKPGSIIVFHDSEKAAERMLFALPKVLEHFSALGYRFDRIEEGMI
jgi:peptidoglycan/xylan/chitin deacetylase (PgdA/CDA1 family)